MVCSDGVDTTIPVGLDEAVEALKEHLEDLDTVRKMDRNEAQAAAHHGIGQWIRNNWGFWAKEGPLYKTMTTLGFEHPDDMSSVIIDCLWADLNDEPRRVDELRKKFHDHWHPPSTIVSVLDEHEHT